MKRSHSGQVRANILRRVSLRVFVGRAAALAAGPRINCSASRTASPAVRKPSNADGPLDGRPPPPVDDARRDGARS